LTCYLFSTGFPDANRHLWRGQRRAEADQVVWQWLW